MPQVECPDVPSHTSVLTVTCHNFGHQHKPTELDPRGGEMILEGGFLPQLLQHRNMVEAQANTLPVSSLSLHSYLLHACHTLKWKPGVMRQFSFSVHL